MTWVRRVMDAIRSLVYLGRAKGHTKPGAPFGLLVISYLKLGLGSVWRRPVVLFCKAGGMIHTVPRVRS